MTSSLSSWSRSEIAAHIDLGLDRDPWIFRAQTRDEARKPRQGSQFGYAEPKPTYRYLVSVFQMKHALLQRQHFLREREQLLALLGQAGAPLAPVEQRRAGNEFELLNAFRDG